MLGLPETNTSEGLGFGLSSACQTGRVFEEYHCVRQLSYIASCAPRCLWYSTPYYGVQTYNPSDIV
jgi:hypothetical protein